MEARILKKVKRRAALCATCAAASLLAACSSTQEAAPEEPSYRSPYQSYRSLCVVPAEEHSASFDLTLARMLRDRGFEPELLETGDLPSVRRCRGIVTFSTGRTLRPFEAPASMSLTFLDAYTGDLPRGGLPCKGRRGTRALCRCALLGSRSDDQAARGETVSRAHRS